MRCLIKSNSTTKTEFTVNGIFDLNGEPTARDVGELSKEQEDGCCWTRYKSNNFESKLVVSRMLKMLKGNLK